MPTSLWWNHLSNHLLVQWGITRGASQEASHPKGAIFKKQLLSTLKEIMMRMVPLLNFVSLVALCVVACLSLERWAKSKLLAVYVTSLAVSLKDCHPSVLEEHTQYLDAAQLSLMQMLIFQF